MSNPEFLGHSLRHTLPLTRGQAIAIYDALLAAGFRYVGPDELAAARLAGKIEGMEEAAEIAKNAENAEGIAPVQWTPAKRNVVLGAIRMTKKSIALAIRAKIAELEATTTPNQYNITGNDGISDASWFKKDEQ